MNRGLLIFFAFLCAHLLSYFFRSTNAVLAEDFRRDLHLSPDELGLMTSLFLGAYAAVQLPLGAALDRWGPRWVISMMMTFAVAGSLITANSDGLLSLALGRTLIGLGMSGTLMGAMKAFSAWFPPGSFASVSSTFVGLGSIGALAATAPLAWASTTVGWRPVFLYAAVVTAAVALLLPLLVRARPHGLKLDSHVPPGTPAAQGSVAAPASSFAAAAASKAAGFRTIFADPAFRRLALMNLAATGTMFAFQGLWGGPVLVQGLGIDVTTASRILLLFAAFNAAGFLASGPLAQRFGPKQVLLGGTITAAALLLLLALAPSTWPVAVFYLIYALLGGSFGSSVLAYAHARELFPAMAGRAVTAANFFGIGGGALIQVTLGWVVAGIAMASGAADLTQPPPAAYRWALACTVLLLSSAAIAYRPLVGRGM